MVLIYIYTRLITLEYPMVLHGLFTYHPFSSLLIPSHTLFLNLTPYPWGGHTLFPYFYPFTHFLSLPPSGHWGEPPYFTYCPPGPPLGSRGVDFITLDLTYLPPTSLILPLSLLFSHYLYYFPTISIIYPLGWGAL